jgi:hypothetical protein
MACWMLFVWLRQLSAAIGQIRHANLLTTRLKNEIETAKLEGGQIGSIGITRAILHGAGYANHFFDPRVKRADLFVGKRPIRVIAIE